MHLLKPELAPIKCTFNSPVVRWYDCGQVGVVEPFICTWVFMDGRMFGRRVDAGYICDGPSVPQAFRDVCDWWRLLPAALGHDWDYEAHGGDRMIVVHGTEPRSVWLTDWCTGERVTRTREECDHIFYAVARQCCGEKQARIAFTAVRLFGGDAWDDEK